MLRLNSLLATFWTPARKRFGVLIGACNLLVAANAAFDASTIAGKEEARTHSDGIGNEARFSSPSAVSVDPAPFSSFNARRSNAGGAFLWGIASGNGVLVTVGSRGTILISYDGAAWTPVESHTTEWLLAVAHGAGRFVAVGDHGQILHSEDAVNWVAVAETGTTARLNNITFGSGLFVAVGEGGTIVTSPNGKQWTPRDSGVTGWLRGVVCNPDFGDPIEWMGGILLGFPRYLAAGEGGHIVQSTDGVTWSSLWWQGRTDVEALATTGANYLGVGANGSTISSFVFGGGTAPPTLMWSSGSTKTTRELRGLAVGGNAVFATGENGLVVTAPVNGNVWSEIPSGTQANLVAAVYAGNSLYVVGENETILQSVPAFPSRLLNISTLGFAGRQEAAMISGFVISGSKPKQVLIRAVGPGVTRTAGVQGTVSAPQLTLYDSARNVVGANTAGWATSANRADLAAVAAAVGAFPLSPDDPDSALLVTLKPGVYSALVEAGTGTSGLCLIEAYDADVVTDEGSKAINVSTRAMVQRGKYSMTAGFVIGGTSPRRVLIRGAGPTLNRYGLSGVAGVSMSLFDRRGDVVRPGGPWAASWTLSNIDVVRDETKRVGAFPFDEGSSDSAMIATLLPGVYSVLLSSTTDVAGLALVEVYDLP